jgi:hypothetical protein
MINLVASLTLAAAAPESAAVAAWMQCLADQAVVTARSPESAEVAADAAMGACAAEEGALDAAEMRGSLDRRRMAEIQRDGRAIIRQRVIARVVEIRAAR